MQDQINQLQRELDAIKHKFQQIDYPLDTASKTIIFDAISDEIDTAEFGTFTAGAPATGGSVVLTINGTTYNVLTT